MAKTRRRGNGEGSIYQRKTDGLWVGVVITGYNPSTGNPKRKYFYSKTRKEVADQVTKALNKLQQGTFIEPNKVTVGQWLDKWMEVYQTEISLNFYARRKELIEQHIKPALNNIPIMKLKPFDVQELYNRLEKEGRLDKKGGLSTGTIRHIHNILNPAMKQAAKEGLVVKNVIADTKPPKVIKTRKARPLNKKEAGKYLSELRESRFFVAFLLDLATGLRRGELLGLLWDDLNFQTGILVIQRQLSRVKHKDGTTSLEYCPLKTSNSYRSIVLPPIVLNELMLHKIQQEKEKQRLRGIYQDEGLIFPNPIGEKLDTRHLYRLHCKALKNVGIPHTAFHDLRHSVASLLNQAGENQKSIQELLGHADAETTSDYTHVLDEMRIATSNTIEGILQEILIDQEDCISTTLN